MLCMPGVSACIWIINSPYVSEFTSFHIYHFLSSTRSYFGTPTCKRKHCSIKNPLCFPSSTIRSLYAYGHPDEIPQIWLYYLTQDFMSHPSGQVLPYPFHAALAMSLSQQRLPRRHSCSIYSTNDYLPLSSQAISTLHDPMCSHMNHTDDSVL